MYWALMQCIETIGTRDGLVRMQAISAHGICTCEVNKESRRHTSKAMSC